MILRTNEINTMEKVSALVADLLKNCSYYTVAENGVIKYYKRCYFNDVLYFTLGDNFLNIDGIIYNF